MFWQRVWRLMINGNPGKVIQIPVVAALPCQVSIAGRANLTGAWHLQSHILLCVQGARCVILGIREQDV